MLPELNNRSETIYKILLNAYDRQPTNNLGPLVGFHKHGVKTFKRDDIKSIANLFVKDLLLPDKKILKDLFMGKELARAIAKIFQQSKKLLEIPDRPGMYYENCSLDSDDVQILITGSVTPRLGDGFRLSESLIRVDFNQNPIGNKGMYIIAENLRFMPRLESLIFSDCNISAEGVNFLSKCLLRMMMDGNPEGWPKISELDLRNNRITDEGAKSLAYVKLAAFLCGVAKSEYGHLNREYMEVLTHLKLDGNFLSNSYFEPWQAVYFIANDAPFSNVKWSTSRNFAPFENFVNNIAIPTYIDKELSVYSSLGFKETLYSFTEIREVLKECMSGTNELKIFDHILWRKLFHHCARTAENIPAIDAGQHHLNLVKEKSIHPDFYDSSSLLYRKSLDSQGVDFIFRCNQINPSDIFDKSNQLMAELLENYYSKISRFFEAEQVHCGMGQKLQKSPKISTELLFDINKQKDSKDIDDPFNDTDCVTLTQQAENYIKQHVAEQFERTKEEITQQIAKFEQITDQKTDTPDYYSAGFYSHQLKCALKELEALQNLFAEHTQEQFNKIHYELRSNVSDIQRYINANFIKADSAEGQHLIDLHNTATNYRKEIYQVMENPILRSVYLKIRGELDSLYLASSIISSGYVENDMNGLAGKAGDILSAISSHIPVIGIGLKLIGQIFIGFDEAKQQKQLENFKTVAVNSVEFCLMSEIIARKIVLNYLTPSNLAIFHQQTEAYNVENFIEFCQEVGLEEILASAENNPLGIMLESNIPKMLGHKVYEIMASTANNPKHYSKAEKFSDYFAFAFVHDLCRKLFESKIDYTIEQQYNHQHKADALWKFCFGTHASIESIFKSAINSDSKEAEGFSINLAGLKSSEQIVAIQEKIDQTYGVGVIADSVKAGKYYQKDSLWGARYIRIDKELDEGNISKLAGTKDRAIIDKYRLVLFKEICQTILSDDGCTRLDCVKGFIERFDVLFNPELVRKKNAFKMWEHVSTKSPEDIFNTEIDYVAEIIGSLSFDIPE